MSGLGKVRPVYYTAYRTAGVASMVGRPPVTIRDALIDYAREQLAEAVADHDPTWTRRWAHLLASVYEREQAAA